MSATATFLKPSRHLLWSILLVMVGLPALTGILLSVNDWRVEATFRLRVGNIGALEQSARTCAVDLVHLSGVTAAKAVLERAAARQSAAAASQFEHWLQEGSASALKRIPAQTKEYCESFAHLVDAQNRFWQSRADRWKSDASGY